MCVSTLAAPLDQDSKHESLEKAKISLEHVETKPELPRPSPINPAIPSEPRPADRILSTKVTPEELKQHDQHKRQIIADTEPGVLIPIKKSGEVLYPEEKAAGAYTPNHKLKEKKDEGQKTKRQTEEHSLPKEKKPVPQPDHHLAELKATQSHVPAGHVEDKPENTHHLIKHEAEHSDNHKPGSSSEPAAHHNEEHSKPPRAHSQPPHQEPHNHDNAHRPARNTQDSSVANPAVHNAKPSETEAPKVLQALPADHGAAATNSQFQTKPTKRETDNVEPIETAAVKELPKADSATSKESNHSPSYVHPVPVSDIIKNSQAAPISHA